MQCVWILHVNLTLPGLYVQQKGHDWPLLHNYNGVHYMSPQLTLLSPLTTSWRW